MPTNEELVQQLQERGITPHDLDDTILALIHDKNADLIASMPAASSTTIMQNIATEARLLTQKGLAAQVEWMDSYYNNREYLVWALTGYLRLPLAA